jgi:hypothetical protein
VRFRGVEGRARDLGAVVPDESDEGRGRPSSARLRESHEFEIVVVFGDEEVSHQWLDRDVVWLEERAATPGSLLTSPTSELPIHSKHASEAGDVCSLHAHD